MGSCDDSISGQRGHGCGTRRGITQRTARYVQRWCLRHRGDAARLRSSGHSRSEAWIVDAASPRLAKLPQLRHELRGNRLHLDQSPQHACVRQTGQPRLHPAHHPVAPVDRCHPVSDLTHLHLYSSKASGKPRPPSTVLPSLPPRWSSSRSGSIWRDIRSSCRSRPKRSIAWRSARRWVRSSTCSPSSMSGQHLGSTW